MVYLWAIWIWKAEECNVTVTLPPSVNGWGLFGVSMFSRVLLQRRFYWTVLYIYLHMYITRSDWQTDPLLPEKLKMSQLSDAGNRPTERTDPQCIFLESGFDVGIDTSTGRL